MTDSWISLNIKKQPFKVTIFYFDIYNGNLDDQQWDLGNQNPSRQSWAHLHVNPLYVYGVDS